MNLKRPDLSQVSSEVRAYIEALENEAERLSSPKGEVKRSSSSRSAPASAAAYVPTEHPLQPPEAPTTKGVLIFGSAGMAKWTNRHLYIPQRRGGAGVSDFENIENETPTKMLVVAEEDVLLVISNFGRAYRLSVNKLRPVSIAGDLSLLSKHLIFERGERITTIIPCPSTGYVVLVNQKGEVRRFRHFTFRETMPQGTLLYTMSEFGMPAAICLTPGESELLIATRKGFAIRFPEESIPVRGSPGIRLGSDDVVVAVTSVQPDSHVFLISADGQGAFRSMSGFAANKVPGASGKALMKTEQLAAAVTISPEDDILALSRTGKVIRFAAREVPVKEGVVQGVYCMTLRSDSVVTACAAGQV